MGVNSLPKTVTRQRHGSSTLTTRLLSGVTLGYKDKVGAMVIEFRV